MKSGLLLSAAASLVLFGSTAVFAQSYAAPGAITLNPGQIQSASPTPTPTDASTSAIGIITLNPGETVRTAGLQDYGNVQAGSRQVDPRQVITLDPGQQS